MIVNGKEMYLEGSMNLAEWLEKAGYNISRIAVELDGRIIPKSEYGSQELCRSSRMEIVSFVGGG